MAEMLYAGEFATESEKRAADILSQLPDDWTVICNKMLATHGRTSEIDFIIIGQRLVFLLDEKSWSDTFVGSDQCWVFANGSSVNSPLNKVDYVARPLAGHLRAKVRSLSNGYLVHAGVLLTNAREMPKITDPRLNNQVFLGRTVVKQLINFDGQQRLPLSTQQRADICTCLYDLRDRPKIPSQIDGFQINEVTEGPAGIRVFQATLNGSPRTLLVYDLTKASNRSDALAFYDREFKALHELQATQVVAEIKDPFTWSEDFRILPVVPPQGKSLAVIPPPETSVQLADELRLARACFETLHTVHSKQVIHRALSPSAIVIQGSGEKQKAIFTNFFAARIEDQSIASQLDLLELTDPYAHPDLAASYGRANRATDQYSLALIFLERVSRQAVADLRRNTHAIPNLYTRWSNAPQEVIEELTELFNSLLNGDITQPREARTVATIFGSLAARLNPKFAQVNEQVLDKRYKVLRLLGKGATAQTYLVADTNASGLSLLAVKQFYNAADVLPQAEAEFNALWRATSKYLPKITPFNSADKEAHVVMEYIPGQTLEELQSEFPWQIDKWWKLADHLLNALLELEEQRLLHRDIKPANIIYDTERDRFVLIDFGFSLANTQNASPAGTPLYWPPEAFTAGTPPASLDRYALALVLFRALTGTLPFIGSDKQHLELPLLSDQRTRRLAEVLLTVLDSDPGRRPQSTVALREQLNTAFHTIDASTETYIQLEPQTNEWVGLVRGLMRTSVSGNGDNRGLDTDFVRETYVRTALDTHLLPGILHHRPNVVFLSGNPGDGKTAFLEQVRLKLKADGAIEIEDNPSGWEYMLNNHTYRSCYDASESHEGLSADEQLSVRLAGLEGKVLPAAALTVLVAINDGRLADFLDRHAEAFSAIKQHVATARAQGTNVDQPIWLIDLKQRAFISLAPKNTLTLANQVLNMLVAPEHWSICKECSAQAICPITANAEAMRHNLIAERLEHLLLLAHLRRQRHITMRDLRSTLALLITSNRSCKDIHSLHTDGNLVHASKSLSYWQAAFTTNNGSDELLGDIAMLDPARQPQPALDRFLHHAQVFPDVGGRQLDRISFATEREWIGAVKRQLYFTVRDGTPVIDGMPKIQALQLLPYRHTRKYIELLSGIADQVAVRERIAQGLLRSDGLPIQGSIGMLSLRVVYSEQQQLAVVKQFPLEQFVVEVVQPQSGGMVESIPELVVFRDKNGAPRIELPMDLFELLMRLADGADPHSEEYKPLLEELVPFKSAMLLREAKELILIEAYGRAYKMTQQDKQIVLITGEERPA